MAKFLIVTDHELTRRKRFHFVFDKAGDVVHSARRWLDCMDYLKAEDETSFDLATSDGHHVETWEITHVRKRET